VRVRVVGGRGRRTALRVLHGPRHARIGVAGTAFCAVSGSLFPPVPLREMEEGGDVLLAFFSFQALREG